MTLRFGRRLVLALAGLSACIDGPRHSAAADKRRQGRDGIPSTVIAAYLDSPSTAVGSIVVLADSKGPVPSVPAEVLGTAKSIVTDRARTVARLVRL